MVNTIAADAAVPKVVPPGHGIDSGPEPNPTSPAVGSTAGQEEEDEGMPAIPQLVYGIAKGDREGKMNHHIPEIAWFHKIEDRSTANIRNVLELKDTERSERVLHITVSRKLRPITKLSGRTFLSAWWHIVVCHYALWGQNIHHRNVSPNNLMVYKTSDGRYIGVLIKFDFSSSPSGQECAGTVPFMAVELLTPGAIEGQTKHLYRHDAVSFIWVLTWVCLRYEDGKLLCTDRPLDEWLKVDIETCRKEKLDFLYQARYKAQPSSSHTGSWSIVQSSLGFVGLSYVVDRGTSLADAIVFETWLQKHIHRQSRCPRLIKGHSMTDVHFQVLSSAAICSKTRFLLSHCFSTFSASNQCDEI
ncbi:hypothetical protein CY34DRAFT_806607 [Suillus luteus UH-Slu-Lm8-n1]|uniref:Fungal-type protein kinase domain-containing protein n=1 Tax=Suillus luteus UH-Slu-Lm8-n1 TaxID=930992 RepID=A0A0D0B3H5_9AGAM|nr:hypothetical protein CY34DRAFT_806607 [Suillus luteus UH-Slu-Lm8-n1]